MKQFSFLKNRAATAVAAVVIVLGIAPAAHADQLSDMQAQINALLAQIAQLQAQLGQGAYYSGAYTGYGYSGYGCTFTRDLAYGMSGSDVSCLQNYLITSGYFIPSGPTGYFGQQTQAAVAVWQAAHNVYPANGYFGSSSMYAYQSGLYQNGGNNNNNGNNRNNDNRNLRGGAATLQSFNLVGDNTNLEEDENNRDVATIRFRPSGGDVRVDSLSLDFQANNNDASVHPWDYFDSITIMDEDSGKKLDSMDVSSSGDWDRVSDGSEPTYELNFNRLDDVIREDDTAHLRILVSTDRSIDGDMRDQSFDLFVPNRGLEAEDSEGRTRTTGDDSDTVRLNFN